MSARKLLITGAAGFTGRHAASFFAAEGAEVTAVLRGPEPQGGRVSPFPPGVRVMFCDLRNREAVLKLMSDAAPDEVLHLAGRNSVPESWERPTQVLEANVMATANVLEALCKRPSVPVLVAGSLLKFRPENGEQPQHPYSLSKTLEEWVALAWSRLFRQRVLVAEPCNLIGPGPSTGFCSLLAGHIAACERGDTPSPFRLSSSQDRRDFLDVRDAVRAYDSILRQGEPGRVYRVDTGRFRTLGEVASRLLAMTSAQVPIDWGATAAPAPPAGQGDADHAHASGLGWCPDINLDRSLRDILEYCRSSGKGDSL
ncbi:MULTISPECIES: NAD-dependent epimerase/dehydratase family protein [Paenibacillus]|uniref:NAD-dependent epimerase/dehydratase family protein n=1 Tax=Paenibacillus TaxID=44249 RepID=UPI001F19BF2C|nr:MULTISPECIES: NAD-dependent epimerase/dehydratase family protein [Paenibacillus]